MKPIDENIPKLQPVFQNNQYLGQEVKFRVWRPKKATAGEDKATSLSCIKPKYKAEPLYILGFQLQPSHPLIKVTAYGIPRDTAI